MEYTNKFDFLTEVNGTTYEIWEVAPSVHKDLYIIAVDDDVTDGLVLPNGNVELEQLAIDSFCIEPDSDQVYKRQCELVRKFIKDNFNRFIPHVPETLSVIAKTTIGKTVI